MLYAHQFSLSTEKLQEQNGCHITSAGIYSLQYDNRLSFTTVTKEAYSLILLGDIYSYEFPEYNNLEIIEKILISEQAENLFTALDVYCGAFVLIAILDDRLYIIPDTAAQREIFYNKDCTFIASQVGLFPLVNLDNIAEHPYYTSGLFKTKKVYIGDTTPISNIKRVLPNHYLDTLTRKCERFFPIHKRTRKSIDEVAPLAAQMLKGFIKAIHHRYEIVVPVTAGFDSRILFLASLPLEAEYYISQHEGMPEDHYEITTAQQLLDVYNKELAVIPDGEDTCAFAGEPHGIDFPRDISFPKMAKGKVVINGNVSEVARNYFRYHNVSGLKLSHLNLFKKNIFVSEIYEKWDSRKQKEIITKRL